MLTLGAACAPVETPPSYEGEPCASNEQCSAGLVCKAALCAKPKSAEGQVCVTDKGCVDGLRCTDGHCSAGRATVAECEAACAHVQMVIETEIRAQMRGAPPEEEKALIDDMVGDIVPRCLARCKRSGTREGAACLNGIKALTDLEMCP